MQNELKEKSNAIRKQITFDLSEEKLKQNYPRSKFSLSLNYHKKAWTDINRFMSKNGFEHRQYSVYVSKEPMTQSSVNMLILAMVKQMPWLSKSLNAFDITNIGYQHSLMAVIEKFTEQIEAEHNTENMQNRK